MVSHKLVLCLGDHGRASLLLKTDHDTVDGSINLLPPNGGPASTRGGDCSLVHEVLQLSSGESRGTTTNGFEIDIRIKGLTTCVDAKNASSALEVGKVDSDLTIESAWTEEGLIQNIHPIGSGDGDDTRVAIETIHLHKNLVNGLLTLIISSSHSGATLTGDGINLINEDDAGGVLLRLSENVTDTGSSHTHEHLNEFRSRDGNERYTSLSSNSLGEKGLTSTRRTIQNHTSGNPAPIL
mmetsp:Transcript_7073/g.10614  ORF Transcript_7073/g.10614 Transcript_7073/m.10614 type:complete len:239 (+) Transcript_7073:829-1545(+)